MPNRIKLENDDIQSLIETITKHAYLRHDIEIDTIYDLEEYLSNYKNDFVFTDIGNMLNINYFGE